jgi:N-acylglucosamine-6-phosphate 2-epimerase
LEFHIKQLISYFNPDFILLHTSQQTLLLDSKGSFRTPRSWQLSHNVQSKLPASEKMPSSLPEALLSLKAGLIVSCQAPINSPLHNPEVMAAIAQAAVNQGATGVRIDTPSHVRAVRRRIAAPMIGLWKQAIPGSEVYITPRFCHAQAIAEAGADLIAIDATLRPRPQAETLAELITKIRGQLHKPVMADVDCLEAAIAAVEAGADCVGTTLYGYTAQTQHLKPPGLSLLAKMVEHLRVPVICEGGISSPNLAKKAIKLGAFAVVVGKDITGIDLKTQAYQQAIAATTTNL